MRKVLWVIAGLAGAMLLAAVALHESLFDVRGPVPVPYPAGEVKEVRVLDAVDVYVDGEPKPGASVIGAIALYVLSTAAFMTFAALRFAGARYRLRWFWLIAAAGLAVAATDELFAVHESIGHNFPELADVPGVKRPDDLLILLYLPAGLAFVWVFRDVLREQRLTLALMTAALACFGLSAASDLASIRIEEWFELLAGLFIAAGLVVLAHGHLKRNLAVRVGVARPRGESLPEPAEAKPEPALRR
jgi:hypothetical protein